MGVSPPLISTRPRVRWHATPTAALVCRGSPAPEGRPNAHDEMALGTVPVMIRTATV